AVATPLERQFGRIAGVTQMTSSSGLGQTGITLQFDLSRNIDAAARDVQAAINAARGQLPANLPSNPNWRKVNPADAPIMIVALTSEIQTQQQMYDIADSVLAQKISQIQGVGNVFVARSCRCPGLGREHAKCWPGKWETRSPAGDLPAAGGQHYRHSGSGASAVAAITGDGIADGETASRYGPHDYDSSVGNRRSAHSGH